MRRNKIFMKLSLALVIVLMTVALPIVPVHAAVGTISVSPGSGTVGAAIATDSGTGFTTGSAFFVNFDTVANINQGTVQAGGVISGFFNVPAMPRGTRNISVVTNATPPDTSNTATFIVSPDITLGNTSSGPGDQITINGAGFSASTTIYIYFDGVSIASVPSQANGTFAGATVTIPQAARGNHTINCNDGIGPSPSYAFTVVPRMSITPTSGAVGSQLTVDGKGFSANSNISFFLDDASVSTPATAASAQGVFTLSSFVIPSTSYGSHTLRATDASGGTATVTFSATQSFTVKPETGTSGSQVQVSGSGFGAGKNITLTFRGATALTNPPTVVADAAGKFTASLTIPPSGGGIHPIIANDGTISATANFTITSTSEIIGVQKGPAGSSVTVNGNGFASAGIISVRWDGAQVSQTVADAGGSFSINIKVPVSKAGEHRITVTDGSMLKEFSYTITPTAALALKTGNVGSDVTMSGNGFNGNAAVNISYDGTHVTTTTANASGEFTAVFKAPVSKGGSHVIVASDGTNSITDTFTMESIPPTVPLLLQPQNKTQGEPLQKFIWTGVNDPSGVFYTFQLATDSNFNTIIIDKRDMTNPGYTLVEKETLKSVGANEPYYWRVRAIDAASNVSDWSPPYSFTVGFVMPQWGIYAIAGAAVVIFFILGFWLGRRTVLSGEDSGLGNI